MKFRHIPLPVSLLLSTVVLLLQSAAQPLPSLPIPAPDAPLAATNDAPEEAASAPKTLVMPGQPRVEKLYDFTFEGATLDIVMEQYCEWTDKIYLKNDSVNANITLKATKLTKAECIQVVEAILGMNNIALVPMDDKFIKVVQANAPDLVGQGIDVHTDPEKEYKGTENLVTQIMQLEHVEITDVQAAVQHLMHAYGKILPLASSNCLMITDTEANIKRVRELLEFIDQPSAQIEPRIYRIKYAEAGEIAATLAEIISMAQEGQQPTTRTSRRTPAGVIRARTARTASSSTASAIAATAGRGALSIQGEVKVISDERTNILMIFSQEENFAFFDKIIEVLDVEVDPAITFEVVNLEYADAMDLAGTLNDLVGAATGSGGGLSSSSRSSSSRSSSSRSRTTGIQRPSSRSSSSRSSSSRSTSPIGTVTPNAIPSAPASIDNLSRLSEETRILADERSNSVLLMGEKSDIAALKVVIKSLDVMLEQVIIEAAIFEIGLGEDLRHGIDWLYRASDGKKVAGWDGNSLVSTNPINTVASGALTYYQNLTGLNSQILINLAKTDQDARLISTPVIMTTDNTEATLSIGEQRPVVTSTDTYASNLGGQRSNYEYKDIGIQLTVTPRINPQRFVVMELTQKADQIGTIVKIDDNEVPTILNREFEASIAVPDGGTVVLGGLVSTELKDSVTKIPILGDIPLIGRYLFSSISKEEDQRELIVLMTPYVMTNMEEMTDQTSRLYRGTSLEQVDWGENNWSQSKLREIPDEEESL